MVAVISQVLAESYFSSASGNSTGAFSGQSVYGNGNVSAGSASRKAVFDASLSNPIYGKSSTVTPASTTLYPWVVAYTAAIPASTAQAAEFQQGLSGKADTSLSNLTDEGKNISNWSNNVSNCITSIPQDIKLELNNGTLTLKAGSKVYVPNGVGVFDVVTIQSDSSLSPTGLGRQDMFCFRPNGNAFSYNIPANFYSGSVAPSGSQYMTWYDTTNNLVKVTSDSGSTWISGYSLPIGLFTSTSKIDSIDQVFNGFGYIGSTVFALPGVKGLIPNGRNEDGTLKNIESITKNVLTTNFGNGTLYLSGGSGIFDGFAGPTGNFYNEEKNIINFNGTKVYWSECIDIRNYTFTPKTAFHAVDYNDKSTVSGWSMPSNRYIDLTLGASGATYTAPANGYISILCVQTGPNGWIRIWTPNGMSFWLQQVASNFTMGSFLPVLKGVKVIIDYENVALTSLGYFRFIYAEGAE